MSELWLTLRIALDIYDPAFVAHTTVPLVNDRFLPSDDDIDRAQELAADPSHEDAIFPWSSAPDDIYFIDVDVLYGA